MSEFDHVRIFLKFLGIFSVNHSHKRVILRQKIVFDFFMSAPFKSFLLLNTNMVCGWFRSKLYLATTIDLSILLKKLPA